MTAGRHGGAATCRSTSQPTTPAADPLEEAALVGALIAAALAAAADNGASIADLAAALAHLGPGVVRDAMYAHVAEGIRSLLRDGTLAGTARLGEVGMVRALGIDAATLLGLRAQAAPLAELPTRAASYADRRHREQAAEQARPDAAQPMGLITSAAADRGGQPTGHDTDEAGPGGERRGKRGWRFDPAIELVVVGAWRLSCEYSERNPSGGIVAQVELRAGDAACYADRLLLGSAHGRKSFLDAVLVMKRPRPPKQLVARLPRALIDLGVAVTGRVEVLEAAQATRARDRSGRQTSHSTGGLPAIVVNDRPMRDITADAIAALRRGNVPVARFFRFGNGALRLRHGATTTPELLTGAVLRGELDRLAEWVHITRTAAWPVPPPLHVVKDIVALPEIDLPVLNRIVQAPVFVPDGQGARLVETAGFDALSGIYLDLGRLGPVPFLSADEALSLIDELLHDFPFVDAASRAHAIAGLLQPVVRDLIDGPTPLLALDAPTERTGKGLLASCIAMVDTGTAAFPMSLPRDDDELDKRIVASLLAGYEIILIDNVARLLDSPSLSAALTAQTYRGRLLGESKILDLPNLSLWIVSGNNLDLSGEIRGRSLSSRLDAGVAHPGRRREFLHRPLLSWVRANRPRLVGAVLALVRAWVEAEMPAPTAPEAVLGGFEEYVRVVGGILEFHGISGFLGDRARLDSQLNEEAGEWELLCERVWRAFQDHPFTAREALALAKGQEGAEPLLVDIWNGRNALAASQRLGHSLHRHRDRRYGRFALRQFVGLDGHSGVQRFRLVPVGEGRDKTQQTPQTRHSSSESASSDAGFAGFAGDPREGGDVEGVGPETASAASAGRPEPVGSPAAAGPWEAEP